MPDPLKPYLHSKTLTFITLNVLVSVSTVDYVHSSKSPPPTTACVKITARVDLINKS